MTPACHHFTQILTVSLPVLDGHERKSMHAVIFLAPFSPQVVILHSDLSDK